MGISYYFGGNRLLCKVEVGFVSAPHCFLVRCSARFCSITVDSIILK